MSIEKIERCRHLEGKKPFDYRCFFGCHLSQLTKDGSVTMSDKIGPSCPSDTGNRCLVVSIVPDNIEVTIREVRG